MNNLALGSRAPYISEYSVFVANLPVQCSNEELGWALFDKFKHFGVIMNLKASRDEKGRPFGFIEYLEKHEAALAISKSYLITIMGRKIRAEHARCQRKIQIKMHRVPNKNLLPEIQQRLTQELGRHGISMAWEIHDRQSSDALCMILKFGHAKDSFNAFKVIEAFLGKHCPPDSFKISWVSAKNMIPSINRMLNERTQLNGTSPAAYSNYYQMNDPSCFGYACNGMTIEASEAIQYHYIVNDQVFRLKRFSMPECQADEIAVKQQHFDDGRKVFIGRINARDVDEEALKNELNRLGTLEEFHLVNRQVIGIDGVMLDAFASARFSTHEEAFRCIQALDGKVIFGQSVKCTWFQGNRFNPNVSTYPPGFAYEDLFCAQCEGSTYLHPSINSSATMPHCC